jgi:hypothetical protein
MLPTNMSHVYAHHTQFMPYMHTTEVSIPTQYSFQYLPLVVRPSLSLPGK